MSLRFTLMTTLSITAKKQDILDHEKKMAHEVALGVLEKPKPPLWMIFVPVFFVFFAQKMRQRSIALSGRNLSVMYLSERVLKGLPFTSTEARL